MDHRIVDARHGIRHRASRPEWRTQVRPGQVLEDLLERAEDKHLIFLDRPANCSSKLLAVKTVERFSIRSVRSQCLEPLEVEQAAVNVVCPRLRDAVHDAAASAAKFRAGAAGHDLKFLYGIQSDIDRSALPAKLLPEETVVVVSAIQADVVEDASLAVGIDFVAVGSLHDANARRQ